MATYSAGTAFLTVVPSFLGVEQAFKKQVRDMAAAADKDLATGVAKGLADANRQARNQGTKGGRDYAGAYEAEAKKALTKAYQSLPEPQPDVNMRKWDKALASVRQDMKELTTQRIGIDIDRSTFDRAIDDFKNRLESLRGSAVGKNKEIGFFNADAAAKELDNLQKFTDEAARRAGAGGELVGSSFNQRLARSLEKSIGKIPDIKIDADPSDAARKLADLRARLVELQSKKIGIDVDATAAYAEVKAIKDELDALDRKNTRVDIRTNARDASAELKGVEIAAEGAANGTGNIGNKAQFSLSRLEVLIALGASLGTVLVPAAAAAAGAIGAIGTAAAAGLSGIGVFALALGGVSDAVKALDGAQAAQAKSAKSVNDANRSMASSADQVRSAQMALANTRRTVAEGAQDAARRVKDAEQGVADARRASASEAKNAAQAVADARRSEKNAEADLADARRQALIDQADADRQVRDAQRDVTDAEKNALDVRKALTQAIQDAKDSMAELDVQLKRNQQDQSVAVTAQMKALEDLNRLRTNPRATQVELRQAQDAYNEQSVRIDELKVKQQELGEQKAKYDKKGVEADDQVIAARKRIATADQGVADARGKLAREEAQRRETDIKAQKKISDAQQNVVKSQEQVGRAQASQREATIRGQESIAKAEEQVGAARRAQSRQAQDGQYQLAQASQAVASAQRSQQAAWDKTATAGGSALDTLNQKMANLSPAQQHFAKFIFGLKGDLMSLRQAAAEPLLPQLETAITNLLKYLPSVNAFVSKVAGALGGLAVKAVDSLGNPVWQRFFGYINQTAVPALQTMFDVGMNVAQGLASIFLALTPFNKPVGTGLIEMSKDFAAWAERLDKTQGYRDFLAYVQENGPRVIKFIGSLGELFINLVKASAPLGSTVLQVLTAVVDAINSIPTPLLSLLVQAISLVSLGFTALDGVLRVVKLKKQITDIFGPLITKMVEKFAINTGLASDATGKFGKATATLRGIAATARDKVVGYASAIASLPGKATAAITGSSLFQGSMTAVKNGANLASTAVTSIGTAMKDVGPRMTDLATNAKNAARDGLDKIKNSMNDVIRATNGPGGLAAGVQTAGEKMGGLAKSATAAATAFGGKIAGGAGKFAGALGGVAKAAGSAAIAVGSKLASAGGSLVSLMGGPWMLALDAGALAIGYFADKSAEQEAKVTSLKSALGELTTTYRDMALQGNAAGAAADEAFKNIVRNNPDMQQAVVTLSQLGVSFTDMVKAVTSGDPSAVVAKLNAEIKKTHDDLINQAGRHEDTTADKNRISQLTAMRDAFQQNATAMGLVNQAETVLNSTTERSIAMGLILKNNTGATTTQLAGLATAWDTNQSKLNDLNTTLGNFGSGATAAGRRADDLTAAINRQYGAAISANEASENWHSTLVTLKDTVAANGKTLDINSAAGLANRDALEAAAKSSRDMFLEEVRAGGKLPEVTKKHQDRIDKLKEEAKKTFGAKSEAVKLIDTYGKIDPKISTKYTTENFTKVFAQAQQLRFAQTMLELGITDPKEAAGLWNRQQAISNGGYPTGSGGVARKATGGPIGGQGTGTSDNQLILASPGEHMLTAAEVQAAGGHDAIYAWRHTLMANRRMPAAEELPKRAAGGPIEPERNPWGLPQYAKGGAVEAPFIVNFANTKMLTKSQALGKVKVPSDGTFTTLSADAAVAKIQKFALAQRGKRYLWSAVGPDHYDCSGLVGNLWALATGHKLYRRYMSTADMGPGKHGMVSGPGKKMTIYLGPGHTAANVGGLHVEAYGGNGTPNAIGRIGTRLSYYNQRLHLPGFAEGGAVGVSKLKDPRERLISFLQSGWPEPPPGSGWDKLVDTPPNMFDGGGFLPPGMSTVLNDTGRPEPVLTGQQWKDISTLARQATSGGGNTYNYEFRDTTLTPGYLKAMQDREAILARVGLPV